ncbi:BLIP family beta-lactamase inhibitor [Streptomyces sp. NPDC055749]
MRFRCLATTAVLAATLVVSAAATSTAKSSPAKPAPNDNYLTDTKYDAVSIGMTQQQVEDLIGTDPSCSGTAEGLMCWTANQFVDQTATFTFNDSDRLYKKEKGFSFAYGWYTYDLPRTMTKAQYETFAVGDLLADVNAVVDGTSCTDMSVEHPNYPSTSGWKTLIKCDGTVDESYPEIKFYFTDGRLTDKTYWSRDSVR